MQPKQKTEKDNLEEKPSRRIFSVSEITRDIKSILESAFAEIWVEGEVSGLSRIATGTTFFSLKDENSILKCVVFGSSLKQIKFELKDGLKVLCFGRVSVYDKRGEYQLYAERIEPKGAGNLQLALEQLKEKLQKEGLFSVERKRQIPYLPSKIGIVTSLTGAAIKDMLKVLDRRFSDMDVVINPVQVQGETAKNEIAQAIKDLNLFNESVSRQERIEVMIVGRGGGSIEDLWAFNEEIVARAIYNSAIPVISAVGHERDVTVADLVADVRAATPSVAAELVAPEKAELKEEIASLNNDLKRGFNELCLNLQEETDDLARRINLSMDNCFRLSANALANAEKKLTLLNPALLVRQYQERVADFAKQIFFRGQQFLKSKEAEFKAAVEMLSGLSPLNILGRGYSITFKLQDNAVIKDSKSIKAGDRIKTRLHNGEIISKVEGD